MDSKNEKKPRHLIIGTIGQLLIILGYRCFSYLSEYMKLEWCLGFNIVFRGLYGFLESIWLIESIVLVIFLSVLIKNAFQNRISWSAILCVCSMLFMSLGIYSIDVINRHINDLISGTQRILETLTRVDFGILIGWIFIAVLSILTAHFIPRLSNTYRSVSPKKTDYVKSYRESDDIATEKRMPQTPEIKESGSSTITDNKSEQIGVEPSNVAPKDEKRNQVGQPQESNSEIWWMQAIIFLLAIPVFIVAVFSVLQSKWMSDVLGDAFKNNTTINAIIEKTTPIAMICMAVFVAWGFAFLVSVVRNCIRKGSLTHPQALATILIEIIFIALSPWLKKLDFFNHFLGEMADGNLVGTVVTLVVFYVLTWVFLVMVSVTRHNTLEDGVKNKCKNLFERIQEIGIGLVDSAVRVIEFATIDYIQSIFGVFGIDSGSKDTKNDGIDSGPKDTKNDGIDSEPKDTKNDSPNNDSPNNEEINRKT